MTVAIGDYISGLTGGLWKLAPTVPATPLISLANDSTGTSATATITGTAGVTYTLYYKRDAATAWTTGLSRVGSGAIVQTGLTTGIYSFVAVGVSGGVPSLPSPVARVNVTDAAPAPTVGGMDWSTVAAANIATFGEPATYVKADGTRRSISVVISRRPPTPDEQRAGILAAQTEIQVINSATTGIASTELELRSDAIELQARVGQAATTYRLATVIAMDRSMIHLGVDG